MQAHPDADDWCADQEVRDLLHDIESSACIASSTIALIFRPWREGSSNSSRSIQCGFIPAAVDLVWARVDHVGFARVSCIDDVIVSKRGYRNM